MRRAPATLSWLIVIASLAAMAVFSVLLFRRVIDAANRDLVPAALTTVRTELKLDVSVGRVHPDLAEGRIEAENVVARSASGQPLVTVGRSVVLLPVPWRPRPNVHIEIGDAVAWVRREASGQFEFQRYIPKRPPQQPIEQAVEVFARNVRVEYRDLSGRRPAQVAVTGLSGAVQVVGRAGHAVARGNTDALRSFSGSGEWSEGAGRVSFEVGDGDVDAVLAALASNLPRTVPRSLQIVRVRGRATGSASWDKKGITSWVVAGRFRGKRIAYEGYSATDFVADLTACPSTWSGTALGTTRFGKVTVTGTVAPSGSAPSVALEVNGAGRDAVPLWRTLFPKTEPPIRGQYAAHLVVSGPASSPSVSGTWSVASARWTKYTGTSLSGYLAYDGGRRLDLRDLQGQVFGARFRADVEYDFTHRYLRLAADTPSAQIERLDDVRKQGLSGLASVSAVYDAPLDKPDLSINISAPNLYISRLLIQDREPWSGTLGDGIARAVWRGDSVIVPLAGVSGPIGRLRAGGGYDTKTGTLSGSFDAGGIELDALRPVMNVSGMAFASGKVTGTTSAPVLDAWTEIYAPMVGGYDASLASGEIGYRDGVVHVANASLRRGAGSAELAGDLDLNGKTAIARNVHARVSDLDAREVLGEAHSDLPLVGLLTANVTAEGPIDNLSVRGSVLSSDLKFGRVAADSLSAEYSYGNHILTVPMVLVELAGGAITGGGSVDPDGATALEFTIRDVGLNALNGYTDPTTPVVGTVSGSAKLNGDRDHLRAKVDAELSSVAAAGLQLGQGTATAGYADGVWSGELDLSRSARSVHATASRIDTRSRTVEMDGDLQLSMADVRRVARRLWPEMPGQLWQAMHQVETPLDAKVSARGSLDNVKFPFVLSGPQLTIGGKDAGKLTASGQAEGDLYRFDSIKWDFSGGNAMASGSVQPRGQIAATADVSNLNLETVAPLSAAMAGLVGHMDGTAKLSGASNAPDIELSAALRKFGMVIAAQGVGREDGVGKLDLRLDAGDFSRVTVTEGSIETDGAVIQKEGYVARLSGKLPFHYAPAFGIPDTEPIQGELVIGEQPLAGLRTLWPAIDDKVTKGRIMGAESGGSKERPIRIAVGGTIAAPELNGDVYFSGEAFGLKDVSETLKAFAGHVGLHGNHVALESLEAQAASGGKMTANADVVLNMGAAQSGTGTARAGEMFKKVMDSPVVGEVRFDSLTYKRPDRDPYKRVTATVNGSVAIGGTLSQPALSGDLRLLGTELPVPTGFQSSASATQPLVNPQLNLTIDIVPGTVIRSPQLEARVSGKASLERSLASPRLSANVSLSSGRIRLPTAVLNLRPGSSVNIAYDAETGPDALAVATVDLYGSTHLTSANALGTPADYRIDMHITGSLIEENGLRISATSSPPDLSEQQILGLLGHQSLFEALGSQASGSMLQTELKGVFASALLPTILPDLGEALRLQELSFSVNKFEPLTVNLTKSLFDGVTMSYRRSLEGIVLRYQVKLLWRLPIRQHFRGELNLGLSYDEQHEQRIGLEWATRF